MYCYILWGAVLFGSEFLIYFSKAPEMKFILQKTADV